MRFNGLCRSLFIRIWHQISLLACAGLAIYYSVANDWYGIVAFLIMWIVVTASCQIFCKHARVPRVFGVPLFPWVPSGEPRRCSQCVSQRFCLVSIRRRLLSPKP